MNSLPTRRVVEPAMNHTALRAGAYPHVRGLKVMPSLKPLKSVAHSLAHHFASTLCYWENDNAINHLAIASKRCHAPIVEIDLLAQTATPSEIQAGMVAEMIPYLKNYLFKLA